MMSAGALFVRRVEIRKQKADRDGLDACGLKFASRLAHRGLVQRDQHLTRGGIKAFWHRLAVPAPHEWSILPRMSA